MDKIKPYRTGRHCVFLLHTHLVFVTKYRHVVFSDAELSTLEGIFRGVCNDFEAELAEFNGEGDHVHLLINYPPKACLSKIVNILKGLSSRRLKVQHPELAKSIYMNSTLWSPSYFAGSVGGAPLSIVKQYIEQQRRPT
jgi:putative transposase